MPEAVIAAATRTPIGRARKGSLVDARPDDLVAFAIRSAVEKVPGLDPADIVDVMVGCGFPQDRQGMNLARRAALLAGLPHSVPGTTVNRFCASSLQTIRMAFHAIRAGEGDVYVAAGVESITQVDGYPKDAEELHPKLFGDDAPIANVYIPMGMTAENVAEQYGVSRDDMDRFAQRSQERAVAAQDSGFFAREITPFPVNGSAVELDDGPRRESTLEKLQSLDPAFKPGGTVTAGNSCPLNDGAAAVVVMSDTKAKELGIQPRARIIASSVSGVEPEIMGVGPIGAVRRVLDQAGMTIDDVDVMELNEAFAAQVLPVCREVGVDPFGEKFNPHGGAIALGHPYGMTGARIMCTLLNDLDELDATIGLETMCVGGGQGMAMIVERVPLIEDVGPDAVAEARAFNADLARRFAGAPSIETLPVEVTRRVRREGGRALPPPVFLDEAEDRTIPTRSGDLRLRVLRPERDPTGVYLHFHGGGWTLGGCDEQDVRLLALANATGLVAASFEYRLAPEHPFPAASDDCEDAALWLLERGAGELGAPAVFATGGESAGAQLTALTLLRLRDRHGVTGSFRAATFNYGSFDLSGTPSARLRLDDPILSLAVREWFRDCYVPGTAAEDRRDPLMSPLYADLSDLPPALFNAAELDPLLDDSLFMAARWRAAGNEAEVRVWPQVMHGFGGHPLAIARAAAEAQWAWLSAALPASA